MGGGASTKAFDSFTDLVRQHKDAEAEAAVDAMKPKMFLKKPRGSDAPIYYACEMGKVGVVKKMLAKDTRKLIDDVNSFKALYKNCEGQTNLEIVQMLVKHGADIRDDYMGQTAMHCCARIPRQSGKVQKNIWRERHKVLLFLAGAKADFEAGAKAGEDTPLLVACQELNEKGALILAKKGADIKPCMVWFNKMRKRNKNYRNDWVAGKVMAEFAFKDPKYVASIKKMFMKMFDKDGDGQLSKDEVTQFFASLVQKQFAAGLMPTAAFTDDGSLTVPQIRKLLEQRCPEELEAWFAFDKDKDGEYDWQEMLPLVKDYYGHIWQSHRPADHLIENDRDDCETAAAATAQTSKPADEPVKLPPGWIAVLDPASGKTYYANKATQASSWTVPTA